MAGEVLGDGCDAAVCAGDRGSLGAGSADVVGPATV
jgi:hypothetical protein